MFDFLKIKYLSITWADQNTVAKVIESNSCLEIEESDRSDNAIVRSITYPKVYHYLGFHFSEEVQHIPYFELQEGEREYLVPITSPHTKETWWIQQGIWSSNKNRYDNEIFRTVGFYNLIIQNKNITLLNDNLEFTVEELEYYLEDFKNDLWLLILDQNSAAKANINKEIPSLFSKDVLTTFKDFIYNLENLIKTPNMFLSEHQKQLPLKRVKPIPKTFRELIEKPNRKQATSRSFYESYDTPENRYIHYCVNRVLYLLTAFDRLAIKQIQTYQIKANQEKKISNILKNKKTKTVSESVINSELNTLSNQISDIYFKFNKFLIDSNPSEYRINNKESYFNMTITFGTKLNNQNAFFINEINGTNRNLFPEKYNCNTIIFYINDNKHIDLDFSFIRARIDFSGFARIIESENITRFYFEYITKVNFSIDNIREVGQLLAAKEKLINRKEYLQKNGWELPLTSNEINDLKKEREISELKLNTFNKTKEEIELISNHLPRYIDGLKKISTFFKNRNVKTNSNCPNSMVFIQNPLYANSKKIFNIIMESNGLDSEIFNSMLEIDQIGLVNISNLYEKWCLVQIIKVLKDVYKFIPEANWHSKLINLVNKNQFDININFTSNDTTKNVVLWYEKQLPNRRRPDFVLDLILKRKTYIGNAESHSYRKRLVMDAKFQNFNQETHDSLIRQLYLPLSQINNHLPHFQKNKNYSENCVNQVFIIHPKPRVIESIKSPLGWGRYCDYGQSDKAKHCLGGIFLSPSLKHPNTIDNLQRLIGMFLQQNNVIAENFLPNIFCISCGNNNQNEINIKHELTRGGNNKWNIVCKRCYQYTLQSLCYNCGKPLFKNGIKWTYHRTRAEQFTNIVCPECESFL